MRRCISCKIKHETKINNTYLNLYLEKFWGLMYNTVGSILKVYLNHSPRGNCTHVSVSTRDASVATDSLQRTNPERERQELVPQNKKNWFFDSFFFNINQTYGHVNKIYKRTELRLPATLYRLSLQRSQRFSQ